MMHGFGGPSADGQFAFASPFASGCNFFAAFDEFAVRLSFAFNGGAFNRFL
jgi:hypothetical protein